MGNFLFKCVRFPSVSHVRGGIVLGLSWFLSPRNAAGPSRQVSKLRSHALGAQTGTTQVLGREGQSWAGPELLCSPAVLGCSHPRHIPHGPTDPGALSPFVPGTPGTPHHSPLREPATTTLYSWIFTSSFPEEKPREATFVLPAADNDRQIDGKQVILSPLAADKICAGIFPVQTPPFI